MDMPRCRYLPCDVGEVRRCLTCIYLPMPEGWDDVQRDLDKLEKLRVEEGILPCSAETPPGVLCSALEPSAQDRAGAVGAGPEEAPAMI